MTDDPMLDASEIVVEVIDGEVMLSRLGDEPRAEAPRRRRR